MIIEPIMVDKDDIIICNNIIGINKFSRPGVKRKKTIGIVNHWTGNSKPIAGALWTTSYFNELNSRYASAHINIGRDKMCSQSIPWDEVAYHAGAEMKDYTPFARNILKKYSVESALYIPGYSYPYQSINNLYIGIEMVPIDAQGNFNEYTIDDAIKINAYLCKMYNIDPEDPEVITRHYDMTGKICPKYFVDHNDKWDYFKQQILKLM